MKTHYISTLDSGYFRFGKAVSSFRQDELFDTHNQYKYNLGADKLSSFKTRTAIDSSVAKSVIFVNRKTLIKYLNMFDINYKSLDI